MDDMDKTMAPQRQHEHNYAADEVTMPGRRDRKPDGRFQIGDLIKNRYKVLAELGQGGMGVVYKCFDEDAGIEVALKALPPELSHNTLEMEDIKENFQLVHNLHHPNIAAYNNLEKDHTNGNYYLIMECCEGEDLRRWIKRKHREQDLTVADILPILKQIAKALDYAHSMKIIHRDIKPGNIMIDAAGNIKVLDFGLAAQIHTSMTRVSMAYHGTSGTGPYMAPEQWRGKKQNAAADQYALAVMTYQLLSGDLPFESPDAAVLQQAVLTQTADEIPNIPKYMNKAIQRAMSKEPEERFVSCADFVAALEGKKVKGAKSSGRGIFRKVAAFFLLLVILAGGAGYYYYDKQQKEQARIEAEEAKRIQVEAEKQRQLAEAKRKQEEEEKQRQLAEAKRKQDEAEKQRQLAEAKRRQDEAEKQRQIEEAKRRQDEAEKQRQLAEAKRKQDEAEKQRQLAEAKRRQDEAEQKKRKDEERALAGFIQETYRLQARVLNKKANIDSLSCDRGQTFGKYLDALKEKLAAGELAMKNNDVRSANSSFKNAEAAADWIIKNVPLRQQVQQLQKQVVEQKEKADKFNSSRLAFVAYRDAENLASSGNRDYESGKFASAENSLRSAISGYEKAYTEARKLTVDDLISSARTAGNGRNWERMQKQAEAALEIDSGNTDAQQLKTEAEKHLKPTLNIIATVDGVRVPATVKFGNTELDTMKTLHSFTENADYKATLSYRSGEDEYVGEIRFNCNWRGPKNMNVTLEKVEFNGVVEYNGMRLEMVKITAGTFMMGSPSSESGRYNDEKQHPVTLTKDYWLGKYEVTQAQWRAVMGNNPSYFKGDNRPVAQIFWNEAKRFCDKLNERYAGKLPRGYKFDLPTEAQWEYACRAGTTTAYSYGDSSDTDKMNYNGNYPCGPGAPKGEYRQETVDVGSLGYKNAWGLYDMHGNVYEWCRDWYGGYSDGAVTDPVGPGTGEARVFRGGSWGDYAKLCRSALRNYNSRGDRDSYLGFRLALVPEQ